jgi:carbon monoxide dehydrogenase subunit G
MAAARRAASARGAQTMASVRKEIRTKARPEDVWAAIRDIGALHTRLVPGFVVDTRLDPGVRIVTFGNGMVVREPIIDINDADCRLVWSAVGARTTHYNAAVQVFADGAGQTKIVWIADLLPDEMAGDIRSAMEQGMAVMKRTLDRLAE